MRYKSIKDIIINLCLFFGSASLSLLIAEFISRLIFHPIDVLSPELIKDEMLGHYVKPFSGGHDAWGFRNPSVPDSVSIAVIGDSQTWGINTQMHNSYPYKLGKLLEEKVYNFGISGYGPVQYLHVLKTKALKLKPSLIVVGLYMGNDFDDAYRLVYRGSSWKTLRSNDFEKKYKNTRFETYNTNIGNLYNLRYWLNHNSVFYRIVKGKLDFFQATIFKDDHKIRYLNQSQGIDKYFNPYSRIFSIDSMDPKIMEGLEISLKCITKMNEICLKNDMKILIALIPTDINVYSDHLIKNEKLEAKDKFDRIINSERILKDLIIQKLNAESIPYVDVIDSLKSHRNKVIYPKYEDGHPSSFGYEIIANAIAAKIGNGL